MAIAFDASAVSSEDTSSPLTWNHTVGAGSNMLLVVGVVAGGNSTVDCSAVTAGGVSMTKARADKYYTGTHYVQTSIWLLHNPGSGSKAISATIDATLTTSMGISCSYSGAQQSSTADAVGGGGAANEGAKTFTVTTVADNCWIFAVGGCYEADDEATITAGQTSRGGLNTLDGGAHAGRAEDTNAAQTPAGNKTMGFTFNCNVHSMTGASFAPASSVITRSQVIII